MLWSGVGGQVCYRSLEGPFRNAFGNMAFHEQHEDKEPVFTFDEAEVELLEDYDEGLDEPEAEPADESSATHGRTIC